MKKSNVTVFDVIVGAIITFFIVMFLSDVLNGLGISTIGAEQILPQLFIRWICAVIGVVMSFIVRHAADERYAQQTKNVKDAEQIVQELQKISCKPL